MSNRVQTYRKLFVFHARNLNAQCWTAKHESIQCMSRKTRVQEPTPNLLVAWRTCETLVLDSMCLTRMCLQCDRPRRVCMPHREIYYPFHQFQRGQAESVSTRPYLMMRQNLGKTNIAKLAFSRPLQQHRNKQGSVEKDRSQLAR